MDGKGRGAVSIKQKNFYKIALYGSISGFGFECKGGLKYIYGTGLYWKGNIRESQFIVDATGLPQDDRPRDMRFVDQKDKKNAECNTVSDGVIQCVLKDYKPARPDASVVVFVGDGCVYFEKPQ